MRIAIDTECTGLDLAHGAMPFLVTVCEETPEGGLLHFWEWDVDPLTRKVDVPPEDVVEIAELLEAADDVFLHNSKFDARALARIGIQLPWEKVQDTFIMGHLLASNHPRNLTDMAVNYLQVDISHFEEDIEGIVKVARGIARLRYPEWQIAREGMEGLPSIKTSSGRDEDKPWKNDMWLPRALIKANCPQYIPEHWGVSCSQYANADSEVTLYLGIQLLQLIEERKLTKIYQHRRHLPRVAEEMESYGVSAIGEFTDQTILAYEEYVAEASAAMQCIADSYGHELELASGPALNDNMRDFIYGAMKASCAKCGYQKRVKHWNNEEPERYCPKCLKGSRKVAPSGEVLTVTHKPNLGLYIIQGKKSGNASLDKDAMDEYLSTLDGDAFTFIELLINKRKHDTDLGYMQSYRRFWVPIPGAPGYNRLHPSLNPCGTDHLRWASNSPNLQNVAKQEGE